MNTNAIYLAISKIIEELSKEGISKLQKNQKQGYFYRGIDDIYNHLGPLLAKHGIVILPVVISHERSESPSREGGIIFRSIIKVRYQLISAEDCSSHSVKVMAEGMDTGDKALNKAMSAAYKIMALQVFCIPLEGRDLGREFAPTDKLTNYVDKLIFKAREEGKFESALALVHEKLKGSELNWARDKLVDAAMEDSAVVDETVTDDRLQVINTPTMSYNKE